MNWKKNMEDALNRIRLGQMIILVDDEHRENEGDLILAASKTTPEAIQFMAMHARGLICLAMAPEHIERLGLPMMVKDNRSKKQTAFTVSIEAATGVTTGISSADRARTVRVAADPMSGPSDVISPGHIFPLKAKHGGVFARQGHTEGSVDLVKLAGLEGAAVICEIIRDDGQMARMTDLEAFSAKWGIPIINLHELIRYRMENEKADLSQAEAVVPLQDYGAIKIRAYENADTRQEAVALIFGDPTSVESPIVRVHSECITGDLFGSLRCDCGEQLDSALTQIRSDGNGVLLYLKQHEGRGIGIVNKLKAYQLQEQGMDTVEANLALGLDEDLRNYIMASRVLKDMGLVKIRLLTNNPRKILELAQYGVQVSERLPLETTPNAENAPYLRAKFQKMGHELQEVLKTWN